MRREYVLFDLDGTLLDSLPLIETSFRYAFGQLGLPWGEGAVMKTIGLPLREICLRFAGERWQELFELYVSYQATIHDDYVRLYPGVLETLGQIKPHIRGMGIVTSKRRDFARRGLALTGLDRYLDHLVALEDVAKPKPDAEPVLRGLNMLGAEPAQAIFVGDSFFDMESGRKAGVITVGVTWGMAGREELKASAPDFLVDTWAQLTDLLTR